MVFDGIISVKLWSAYQVRSMSRMLFANRSGEEHGEYVIPSSSKSILTVQNQTNTLTKTEKAHQRSGNMQPERAKPLST